MYGGLTKDPLEYVGPLAMTSVKSEVEMAAKPEIFISPKPEPVIVVGRDENCSSLCRSKLDKVNHRSALQRASFQASGSPASQTRKKSY